MGIEWGQGKNQVVHNVGKQTGIGYKVHISERTNLE